MCAIYLPRACHHHMSKMSVSKHLKCFTTMKWSILPIGKKLHQPIFKFSQPEFGQKTITKHSFQVKRFPKQPWLHYNKESDSIFVFNASKHIHKTNSLGQQNFIFQLAGFTQYILLQYCVNAFCIAISSTIYGL